ncbi:hypothetical protein VDG1235_789 [Verrucomicrobiia bacterium DG1235]|nr:hypothetical protein VDG1235_789 [Verrucomicrobiae bacterium DG1235]
MNWAFLLTLGATGFVAAFLHAAIPTHWLPFVAIGQARGWTPGKTVGAVALAGGGHVLVTTALGVGLAWFGFELSERFEHTFHWVVAGLLIGLGVWLIRRGKSHRCASRTRGFRDGRGKGSDHIALWSLFLVLTLTPCEVMLPVYLSASPYGLLGIAFLSAVLAVATLGAMMAFTWFTARGVRKAGWAWLESLDQRIIGALFCLLGIATVTLGHSH